MKRQTPGLRRTVITALCLVIPLAAGCGSSTAGSKVHEVKGSVLTRTLKVGVLPTFNGLDAYVAAAEGYFEDEGLNVELVEISRPADAAPQLLGGSLDISLTDTVMPIVARSEGVPFVAVAPAGVGTKLPSGTLNVGNIWVSADSKVKSVKDLESASIAVPQINSQVWLDVRSAVDAAGGDSSKIKFVEAPDQLGALKSGNVDASTSSEPKGTAAMKDPALKHLDNYTTAEGGLAYMFTATQQMADENPATVAAFQRAILKANDKTNSDPAYRAKVAKKLRPFAQVPVALLKAATYPTFDEKPLETDDVGRAVSQMVKYGLITEGKAPKADDLLSQG